MIKKTALSLLSALFFVLSLAGCSSQKMQESDKAFIVRATDLVDFGYGFKPINKHESFDMTQYFDGSIDIDYEFETPDKEQKEPLYLNVTLTSEAQVSDALFAEGIEKVGRTFLLKQQSFTLKPLKGAKKYGTSSALYLLMYQGQPTGNYFVCRKGKRTYTILISGNFYIDDPAEWDNLVRAKMNKWLNAPPVSK